MSQQALGRHSTNQRTYFSYSYASTDEASEALRTDDASDPKAESTAGESWNGQSVIVFPYVLWPYEQCQAPVYAPCQHRWRDDIW